MCAENGEKATFPKRPPFIFFSQTQLIADKEQKISINNFKVLNFKQCDFWYSVEK